MASGSALGARADPQPDLHTRAHQSQVISKVHPRLPGTSEGQTPEVGVSLSLPAGQAERGWACSSLLPAPRPASRETGGVRRKAACSCSQSWAPSAQKTFPLSRSGSPKGPSSKPQGAQDRWVSQSTGRLFHSELPPETSRLSPKRHHPSHPRAAVGRVCAENLEKAPDLSSGLARSSPSRLPEGAPCEALAGLGWI